MTTEIAKLNPAEYGLKENEVQPIEAAFMPKIIEREALMEIYESLITQELTPELCTQAKSLRLKFVKVRTGISDIHKTQKAYFLAAGRFVDAWKNKETLPGEQAEEVLENIEKHFENIERERKNKLRDERLAELSKYEMDGSLMLLGEMKDEVWINFLAGAKLQYEQKKEAERKAEEERLAAIEAEKKRQKEIRLENERLKKEREELEKAQEAERKKMEAEKVKAEKARRDAEAKMLAQAKADREKLEAARAEKEKAEAELRQKREAEDNARKESEARAIAEEKSRIAAEKARAAAPDKIKLQQLASDIKNLPLPELKTAEANAILSAVKTLLFKVNDYISEKTNTL
jgi:DNA repair exonuclease SbcCD ATPase subunit